MSKLISILLILVAGLAGMVALAADKQVNDNELYDQVRRKLANDPLVKGGGLDVIVEQGVVTITGVVDNDKRKEKAEKVAAKVKGVKKVINQIRVAPVGSR